MLFCRYSLESLPITLSLLDLRNEGRRGVDLSKWSYFKSSSLSAFFRSGWSHLFIMIHDHPLSRLDATTPHGPILVFLAWQLRARRVPEWHVSIPWLCCCMCWSSTPEIRSAFFCTPYTNTTVRQLVRWKPDALCRLYKVPRN